MGQEKLLCQNFCNGRLSACFVHDTVDSEPTPVMSWMLYDTYMEFREGVIVNKKEKKIIYSLTCDDTLGFGVGYMEVLGHQQTQVIVTDQTQIRKHLDEGKKITACSAFNSKFYVVMTANVEALRSELPV